MPNAEDAPPPGALEIILEGGLPQIIAGPAGKAISRLIAGAADIPAAWLEKHAQRIRDETEARTGVIRAMTQAAGTRAGESPELIDRAIERWVGVQSIRQDNREKIASRTVEHLQNDSSPAEGEGPSDDWMNVFEDFAERASSEQMRDLWSRILAGEIRKAGSFSLLTLSFASTLEQQSVDLIVKALPWVLDNYMIMKSVTKKGEISENLLIALENIGFGMYGSSLLKAIKVPTEDKSVLCHIGTKAFRMTMKDSKPVDFPSFLLSIPGRELSTIIPREYKVDELGSLLWELNPEKIELGEVTLLDKKRYLLTKMEPYPRSS